MTFDLPDLPPGWTLTHIILLDSGCWQVNAKDDEHVVCATGNDPADATHHVVEKILLEDYSGAFHFVRNILQRPIFDPQNMLVSLGLAKPLTIKRRKDL